MNLEQAKLEISLLKLSQTHVIQQHCFSIDDSDNEGIGYDVIILGQDLYQVLGLNINYIDCTIQKNDRSITIKNRTFPVRRDLMPSREFRQVIARSEETKITAEATERIVKIKIQA